MTKIAARTSKFILWVGMSGACAFPTIGRAAFPNYNSVMLGDRAGGMGGAFTALTGDCAASAYYNPATLARLEGSSLSTSVNLFNKHDTTYGGQQSLDDAIFRINKGTILSIPSASGIFTNFGNFAAGLSIVMPDYHVFGDDVYTQGNDTTFLRVDDRSLWVGGAFALNLTEKQSLGGTAYYTSRSFSRSLYNRYDTGSETISDIEEKSFSTNALIYSLGYYLELTPNWHIGVSYRLRSIPISGRGSQLRSTVGTVSGAQPVIHEDKINNETRIPDRLALGVAYALPQSLTVSADVSYYGSGSYNDGDSKYYNDRITQKNVINVALGFEKYLLPWLPLRLGLFTDLASTPDIPGAPLHRYQDHIDKYGFSANFGLRTTEHTTITLGGYYLGGEGQSSELIGSQFQRIRKTERVFSFLVGSAYSF